MATNSRVGIRIEAEDKTGAALNAVSGNLDKLNKKMSDLEPTFQRMTLVAGAAFAAMSYGLLKVVQAGANFEQTNVAFETMLGSAERAQKLLSDLNTFALKTPFELGALRQSSKELLAFGIKGDDIIKTLTTLGNISAGVGMDKLPQLTLAFGQVRAAGRLTGSELRQFTEAGVPLLEELSKVTGMSVKEMAGNIGELRIPFEQVEEALGNLTSNGGRFADLMEKQSRTLAGSWSNLKDTITKAMEQIGAQFTPILTPIVLKVTEVVGKILEWVQAHPQLAAAIAVFVTACLGLATVVGTVGLAILGLSAAGAALIPVLAAIGITVGGAAAALLTTAGIIVGVVVGVAALIAAGVYLYKHWDEVKAKAVEVWGAIKDFLSNAWDNIKAKASEIFNTLTPYFKAVWDAIVLVFKFAVNFVVGLVLGAFKLMWIDLIATWEQIKIVAGMFWDFLKQIFNTGVEAVKAVWTLAWDFIKNAVAPVLNGINDFVKNMWGVLKAIFATLSPMITPVWEAVWTSMKNFVGEIWNVIKDIVKGSLNWIIAKVNEVISLINQVASAGGGVTGMSVPQIPNIPQLAEGGIVKARPGGMLANIGEGQYDEAVIPLKNGAGFGGSNVTVNITGTFLSEDAAVKLGDILINKLKLQMRGV